MISNKPKSKQRYLSPSFKKGAIKKEKDKEEEFKLNLILNGAEDDDSESPKSPKKAGKRLSLKTDKDRICQVLSLRCQVRNIKVW